MIVLSFVLVIVAAVTLVIGLFQTDSGLAWIWTSIGSCVAAMVFLGIGVLQRRGARPRVAADDVYRPGPVRGLSQSPGSTLSPAEPTDVTPEEFTIVTGGREPAGRFRESEGILASEGILESEDVLESERDVESEGIEAAEWRSGLASPRTAPRPGRPDLEAGRARDLPADRRPPAPQRTPESDLARAGSAAAVETPTAEVTAAENRTPGRPGGDEPASAAAAPTQQPPLATPPRPATKETAPSTAEPTSVKKTARKAAKKAAKKATLKKATTAPAAGRGTAPRARVKKTTGRTSGEPTRPPTPETAPARPAPEAASVAQSAKRPAHETTGDAARAELGRIKGLGPAKQEALLREFGSVEAIRAATVEQLTSIRGIGETTAREILTQARR